MAEQRMKVRDKKVQKMTKDGLVEENLTDKSSVRVSNRVGDVQMGRKQGEKEENLVDKSPRQSERSGKNIRPSVQKSRDAPELIRTEKQSEDFGQSSKQQNRKRIRAEVGKESRLEAFFWKTSGYSESSLMLWLLRHYLLHRVVAARLCGLRLQPCR